MRKTFALLLLAVFAGAPAQADAPLNPPVGTATETTRRANASVAAALPLDDKRDFRDASRGRLAQIEADAIRNEDGEVVWDIAAYDFLQGPAPDTVNPSLWRQAKLAALHGLFEVVDGIYQVRGYDLAVMTLIRGERGWIVVDPLTTRETAAAALALANQTLGQRPVTGVIYTHSHADHFGGVRGVIDEHDARRRGVPILAPRGFLDAAIAENLLAGNHMSRRVTLMFGSMLERSPLGHVSSGLGPALANGAPGLIPPTEELGGRDSQRTIDGVRFQFIDAAGTEAPAEFMFYLPGFRALCTAEVASGTLHNALTLRGAKARDLLRWSEVIDHLLVSYAGRSDVVFASHHWPTWGRDEVRGFLTAQRDIYRYIHDQTLRRANAGATIVEVAEQIGAPAFASEEFSVRDYYGTLNHNAKAVYQYYFGWWDGVPAHFYQHPPEARAARFVALLGGADNAVDQGRKAFGDGDYRWAAEILSHAVFADPDNEPARAWLAASYEQLGFQAESGAWRSYFLSGARELRLGTPSGGGALSRSPEFLAAVTTADLFDNLAARYAPEKLGRAPFELNVELTDSGQRVMVQVGAATAVPRVGAHSARAATLRIARADLDRLLLGKTSLEGLLDEGAMRIEGDAGAVRAWLGALDRPAHWFNVVVP